MDHISGPDHSTLPTHQTGTQTRTLSRRKLLAGAAGGVAVVAAGQPAWAADATRPGAVRGPALAVRDSQVVKRHPPLTRAGRPAGALRAHRTAHRRHRLGEGGRGVRTHLLRSAGCRDVRLEPFAGRRQVPRRHRRPRRPAPDDICWQAGASPGRRTRRRPRHGPRRRRQGRDRPGVADRPGRGDRSRASSPTTPRTPTPDARVNQRAAFVLEAQRRGAAAVVLLPADLAYPRRASATSPRLVPTTGSTPPPWTPVATIPVLGVAQVQKRLLREDLSVRPLRLTIGTTSHRGLTSNNVLADIPGRLGANGPLVYVSGHYDSVIGAPGRQRRRLRHRAHARARPGAAASCPSRTPPSGSRCGDRRSRA